MLIALYNTKYHSLSSHITFIKNKEGKMMLFKRKIEYVALIGMLAVFGTLCMTSFSFAQGDAWATKANMLTERSGHSTCVVNGKIYTIGGVEDAESTTISTVEEYDPATDTWTTKTGSMQTPRSWFGSCAVNGKIYTIGGGTSVLGVGLSTVDEYDPVADTWTSKTAMPTARYVLSASVVNGKIYAIGGKPGHGVTPLTTVEEYDPATDTWTTKTGMNKERFGLSTCVINGKIYAIGGTPASDAPYPGLATVEEYDPATDTWTTKTNMPVGRAFFSASAVDGKIYAIGGGRDLTTSGLSIVEEYDPETDSWTSWTTKTNMPTARFLLSTSAVNDKIYAIGGAVSSWSSSPQWQGCTTVEEYDPSLDNPTSVGNPSRVQNPNEFLLYQNYPNPFNPETTTEYVLAKSGNVKISIYNISGQTVKLLKQGFQHSGSYKIQWNGRNNSGQAVPSGIYLLEMIIDGHRQTKRMLLLK
jgi:N-acetylneuraminic acid mutarotase